MAEKSPQFSELNKIEEELLVAKLQAARKSIFHAGERGALSNTKSALCCELSCRQSTAYQPASLFTIRRTARASRRSLILSFTMLSEADQLSHSKLATYFLLKPFTDM